MGDAAKRRGLRLTAKKCSEGGGDGLSMLLEVRRSRRACLNCTGLATTPGMFVGGKSSSHTKVGRWSLITAASVTRFVVNKGGLATAVRFSKIITIFRARRF